MSVFKRVTTASLLLAVLAIPLLVVLNAQALSDWWQLRGYSPPRSVAGLASQDGMTAYAKHIYYVNHPDIVANISAFRSDCQVTEQAIVLGCYHSDQKGIFIYQLHDSRLNGLEQVTAAHEMLHAAYDRLSSNERNYVDNLLQSYYDNELHDQRVIDEINQYKQTEPHELINEMHSVLGTEVANLPTPLQTYYQRYFSNRSVVANYAAAYETEFTSRQSQIKADDAQLAQLKLTINSQEQSLQSQLSQINSDRAQLDSERASGQIGQYNSGVISFNREIDSYNSGISKLRHEIDSYNSLVDARNAIAADLASLSQALDTRLVPQAGQ